MRVTSKYLLGNFIPPFMVSCLFFVCFLLIFQLFRITKIVVQKGIEIEKILILVSHIAITFVPLAIPLACFFATIYTMNRMSDDSEIVVMRSVGLNKFQLFRPFLLIGVLIAFSVYGLNRNIIPRSKTIFKNTVIKLTSKGMFSDIRPETFFTDIPNVILFAKGVDEERSELK
ncbi:MAG: LptF/LptG family permease, partial [Bacteriovoracaceae bacterium]